MAGMCESSYEERQEDEVEFLQAVFPGDFQDLRMNDSWKIKRPPEIQLTLVPQKSMGGSARDQRPLSIRLVAKYPTDYPDSSPELKLEEPQGLTTDQVQDLTKEIQHLARERTGEVMMLEIAQKVQQFLHKHDRPHVSLYDEMLQRQRQKEKEEEKRLEAEKEARRIREEEEHRQIEEEIKRKKAELRERIRRPSDEEEEEDFEDSNSEESHTADHDSHHLDSTKPSFLPDANMGAPAIATEKLVGGGVGREGGEKGGGGRTARVMHIQKGRCLGESSTGGHIVHVGMDSESGDLLAIYDWELQCRPARRGDSRRLKQVGSIQQEFDSYQQRALYHPNLVQYLAMTHSLIDNKIKVEVVMEYVGGGSVSSLLRNPDCGPVRGETLCHYCKQLLESLSYLHSQGVVHNDIKPSLVFFESGGTIKLGGFSIIKRLTDLHRAMSPHVKPSVSNIDEDSGLGVWPPGVAEMRGGKKGDILKLGMLILCLAVGKMDISYPPSLPMELPDNLRDFLAKCLDTNEQRRVPARELLHHPFIAPSPLTSQPHPSTTSTITRHTTLTPLSTTIPHHGSMQFQRSDSIVGSPCRPFLLGRSRLETEFEELEVLGSGGFGDVMKVRNHLDGRLYAIKRIRIRSGSKMMNRITREVELLSQMNHENVVRYYNAWIETFTEDEFDKHSGTDPNEESSSGSDTQELENTAKMSTGHRDSSTSSDSSGSLSSSDYGLESEDTLSSGDEEFLSGNDSDGSFIKFEASTPRGHGEKKGGRGVILDDDGGDSGRVEEEGEEEDSCVFMDRFSESSGEQRNFLGELETQVMNLSMPKLRMSTAESSDTVVFADSSTTLSRPIPTHSERKRDRRRQKTSGQVQFLYIQMEYCENQTLRQLIDQGELHSNEDRVWRLFREIVEGLEHIHSKGMIHRDLKPGNIFLNSSGHIKIGDFGLATSYKHPMSKQSSILVQQTSMFEHFQEGDTGLVGTAMYVSPELLKSQFKYTPKVDLYSLGIIFFEMCHAPVATLMERAKMLSDIRGKEILLPPSFEAEKEKQAKVIRSLLSHNPHDRPTSKQLLQNPLLPLKMEDEELQEVLLRTLQSTNSTRYRHLIDELFSQEGTRVSEFSYFVDPQDTKRASQKKSKFSLWITLVQQLVHTRLAAIFTRHGASFLQPLSLSPRNSLYVGLESSVAQFMDRSGAIVSLPYDHRVPFARYITYQDISYLKRYTIGPVYRESKVLGSHPREIHECTFDIVSPSPSSLVPDAEVMFAVSEIIAEIPGLQESQYSVWVGHTFLLSSILSHCSIPAEKHSDVCSVLHKLVSGAVKSSELEKRLKEKNLQLSPLAAKTLHKFVASEVSLEEAKTLLEPLLKDKTAVGSQSTQAWQEITTVVSHFRAFGAKEPVYVHLGLTHSPQHFSGVIFQFVDSSSSQSSRRRVRRVPLATGGRYDGLLGAFRRPGKQSVHPGVSVVGVSVLEEMVVSKAMSTHAHGLCPITKCSVLVCWLGRESLQNECIGLVKELWSQGVAADLVYESLELDSVEDIQEFCRRNFIPHVVVLSDRTLFFERKQVKVRTLESGKWTEKIVSIGDLVEFLQQRHGVERSDSLESREGPVRTSSSHGVEPQSNVMPPVNVNIVGTGKLPGHTKRRYHDQALTKLIPLLQKFSPKLPLEVLVMDLKTDVLCHLAAEVNKLMGSSESKDLSPVVKTLTESHNACNKKYIARVCETIQELLNSKRVPVIFLYSHTAEYCQTVLNSLESLVA